MTTIVIVRKKYREGRFTCQSRGWRL